MTHEHLDDPGFVAASAAGTVIASYGVLTWNHVIQLIGLLVQVLALAAHFLAARRSEEARKVAMAQERALADHLTRLVDLERRIKGTNGQVTESGEK
jgi:hypothetical protein